jgi:hypothetical protein
MPKALTILLVVTLFCLFSYSQTSTYAEQTLIKSTLITSAGSDLSVGCQNTGCTATTPLVPSVSVTCPRPAGADCIFVLTPVAEVYGQVFFSSPRAIMGFFKPNVSGAAAAVQQEFDFFFALSPDQIFVPEVATFTFVIPVTNTVANQSHSVTVYVGCTDTSSIGACGVTTNGGGFDVKGVGFRRSSTLRIDVYKSRKKGSEGTPED